MNARRPVPAPATARASRLAATATALAAAAMAATVATAATGPEPNRAATAATSLEQALAVAPYPAPPATPGEVLLKNATVWTQAEDGILEGADVLVRKGRIAAVGRDLAAGAGALVVDATGRHVTPGIIDAHSHSATEALDLNEGVNSISAEVRVADVLDPQSREIYLQLAGGVTAAHVLHGSGNTIGGQSALIKYRWGATAPRELLLEGAPPTIKFALGENPTQAAFRSGMPGENLRYPATRMGVAALVRTSFAEAAQYRDEWRRYDALSKRQRERTVPPRRDLRMDALVEVLEGRRLVHAHSYRADEILMLMRVAEESGIRISTFQHVLEGYRVADEMAAHGAAGSTFSDWWSFKAEAFDAIPYNAALMAERGVLTSLNSDNADLARRLNLEAAKTIRYGGLGRQQALDMVTTSPARQLGIAERTGSIAAGKDADLVVWSGDPLSVYSVADMTFVDGRLRFSRETDRAHRAVVAAARAALAAELGAKAASPAAPAAPAAVMPNPAPPPERYRYAAEAPAATVAITGATVHTMAGPAIAEGVVVFAGGRVTAVGGPGTAIPAGAERVAAAGKHLWPGLIHANSVLGISEIDSVPGTVDVSETGDVNADADVSPAVNAASRHFPVARSGGITHAVVVPSGGLVAGTTSLLRTDGWTWDAMTAVRQQAVVLRWPEPVPPQYAVFLGGQKNLADRRKESDERIAELEKLLDGAAAYGRAKERASRGSKGSRAPEYDPQLEALQPVLRGERPLWASAREKHAIEAAVALAAKRKLRLVITDVRDAYLVADLLARHQVPVVLTNIVGEPPRPDDPYDVLYTMPAKLEAAGVTFAIASGTRSGGSANARHITLFAGIAAAYGLDREAAYRSLTLYPAKILGLEGTLGSIAPGKSASFVLTDGDLLEPATQVEQVWIDGTRPSMDDDQKAFYRQWRARPKPVVAPAPQG